MANECYFQMRIYAPKNNANEFVDKMHEIYRIYDIWPDPGESSGYLRVDGNCAWSIISSMRNGYSPPLEELTKKYHVCLEAWSVEFGMGFYEHYLFEDGKIKVDDCFDMEIYDPSKFDSVEEFNEFYHIDCDEDTFNDAKQDECMIDEEQVGDGREWTWEDLTESPHYMFYLTPISNRNIEMNSKITDLF